MYDDARALTQKAVTAAQYEVPGTAHGALKCCAAFVSWTLAQDVPLDVEAIFTPSRVETYISTKTMLSARTLGTYRALLRRVGRYATKRAPWPAYPVAYGVRETGSPPYTARQLARYWEVADAQHTARQQHVMRTVLALGLGVGPTTSELIEVRARDVNGQDGHLSVDLPGRRVPVRSAYTDVLLQACRDRPEGPLVGDVVNARDRLYRYMLGVTLPQDLPSLRVLRLRATWSVALLSAGVTVSEYTALSGAKSARTLEMLIRYVEQRDLDDPSLARAIADA